MDKLAKFRKSKLIVVLINVHFAVIKTDANLAVFAGEIKKNAIKVTVSGLYNIWNKCLQDFSAGQGKKLKIKIIVKLFGRKNSLVGRTCLKRLHKILKNNF